MKNDLDKPIQTAFGDITTIQYRLFTSNYAWLVAGPGGIISTGYYVLSALFFLASLWLFLKHPIAKWLRANSPWFTVFYVGWSVTWVLIGLLSYPSTENMGKLSLALLLFFINGLLMIPHWREMEKLLRSLGEPTNGTLPLNPNKTRNPGST